ncbi:MAG: hypothetical protein WDO24_05475 [Pseudomonadota bacterium]
MAGVLLSDSEYRHELQADIEPFEGLRLGFFFISVGMSANLELAVREPAAGGAGRGAVDGREGGDRLRSRPGPARYRLGLAALQPGAVGGQRIRFRAVRGGGRLRGSAASRSRSGNARDRGLDGHHADPVRPVGAAPRPALRAASGAGL